MPKRGIPEFSTVIHHKKGRDFDDEESEGGPTAAEQAPPAASSDVRDGGPEADTTTGPGGSIVPQVEDELSSAPADVFHALRSVPEPSETPGGASTHYVGIFHGKTSDRENDADALSKADEKSLLAVVEEEEVHRDGSGNELPLFSLRDVHKSSDGHAGSLDLSGFHAKVSEENDARNPDVEPERWIPPPREELAPPAPPNDADGTEIARPGAAAREDGEGEPSPPEVEIERVNVAPEPPPDAFEECTPVDGAYRHPSAGGKAGSGVVIRYQYELIQSTRSGDGGGIELVDDILPRLEEGITDKLLPVFFEECNGAGAVYDSRGLAGEGGLRRRLSGGEVVGIDAHPADVAIGGDCEVYTVRDPFQTTTCHRIEGSMTLFFPPNAAVSTLLRSARLSALRAVAAGMEDGSLNGSHDGIRSLIFLDSSHRLDAILPPDEVAAEPEVVERGGGNGKGGFIAMGVTVSFLLLAACVGGFVLYRRAPFRLRVKRKAASPRRRRGRRDEEEGKPITEVVKPSKKERRKRKTRSRGRPSSWNGADADVGSADGTASRVSTHSEHDGESSTHEEDAVTASEDEGQASSSADESSSSSSSSSEDEQVGGGAPDGSDSSSSDEDDDFDASSNVLYSTFESSLKEEARKARERKEERRRARIRRRLKRHNRKMNRNVVTTGGGEGESVATGASAGVHSASSAATDMVRNIAGVAGTDDASAVTGVSAATEKAGNVVPRY